MENEVATFRMEVMSGIRVVRGIKKFNRRKGKFIKNPEFERLEKQLGSGVVDPKKEVNGKIKSRKLEER